MPIAFLICQITRMLIRKIGIRNFRNAERLDAEPSAEWHRLDAESINVYFAVCDVTERKTNKI